MFTFEEILNVLIPGMIVPFAVEFIKNKLKITYPLVSMLLVLALSVGTGYLFALLFAPEMPMANALRLSAGVAIVAIGLKNADKSGLINVLQVVKQKG